MYLMSFKQVQYAQTFVDYMKTKGIILRIELDSEGNYELYIDSEDENVIIMVKTEIISYLKDPFAQRYSDASWQIAEKISSDDRMSVTFGFSNLISVGHLTKWVTIICLMVYLLLLIFGSNNILSYLGYPFNQNYMEFWRYLTPAFIHFSLLHLLSNLVWWWYLGGMIEKYLGSLKLLEILLLTGILANYATGTMFGPNFGGLSGVVYGLMGYVWLYGEKMKSSGIGLDRVVLIISIIWLVAGYTGWLGPIANTAHLIGLIIGLLLAAKDIWLIKK